MSPCLKRPSLCGSSLISLPDTGRNTSLPEGLCGAHSSTLGPMALHWGQTPPCMEALSDGRGRLRRVLVAHSLNDFHSSSFCQGRDCQRWF
ncbi:unnamed protein product [Arctogadus glacialis]